ncbi:MAG: family 10 glycosylhydrolase [Ruminococcus sp.]|nr:family 10 glycosylhydrolase [Ruminococcus sp.]
MLKKVFSFVLIFLVLISTVVVGDFSAAVLTYTDSYGTFTYTESANGVTITAYDGEVELVNIPSKINGKSVVKIASKAFNNEKYLKNIFIYDSVKEISKDAFYNCKSLTYAYINPYCGVNSTQFSGCENLLTVACKYKSELWKKQAGKRILISTLMNRQYTGSNVKPIAVINHKGKILSQNIDYSLSYSDNKNPGTAKCKITFKGKYKAKASKTIRFAIRPSKSTVSAVSYQYGKLHLTWDKNNNADGYEIYYSTDSGFKENSHRKIVKNKNTTSIDLAISPQWSDFDLYYVRIRCYQTYKNKKYYSAYTYDKSNVYQPDANGQYKAVNFVNMKGIWISYLDFNLTNNDRSFSAFKKKFKSIVKTSKSNGYNTLIVQVHPFNDAMYYSEYFPYSHIISGKQGKDPGYDALKYMSEYTHSQGMSIHAWINPYRVRLSSNSFALSSDNPYIENPSMGVRWNNDIYLNPANRSAQDLIVKSVSELVNEYKIDGVQFDDYFYPTTSKDFDSKEYSAYKKRVKSPVSLSAWRKSNVNNMVKSVYKTIKNSNKYILFGISPQGNYNNNAYLYADVKTWCTKKGYVDYICPQIYWSLTNPTLTFDNAIKKWTQLKFHNDLKFYVGLAGYKSGSKTEDFSTWRGKTTILKQEFNKSMKTYSANGVMVFRYSNMITSQSKAEFKNLAVAIKKYSQDKL